MNEPVIGLVRHVLTFGGGYAVASGTLTEPNVEILVGALITIIGAIWSIVNKKPNLLKTSKNV